MTLEQRRRQVANDERRRLEASAPEPGPSAFREIPALKSQASEEHDTPSTEAELTYHPMVLAGEVRDSQGRLMGVRNVSDTPNVISGGFFPEDGEKYTFKASAIKYETSDEIEVDHGLKAFDIRIAWGCRVNHFFAYNPGAKFYTSDAKTVMVPSVRTGRGAEASFEFTWNEKICVDDIRRNESLPKPANYTSPMVTGVTPVIKNDDGTWPIYTVGGKWGGDITSGGANPGVPENQTYGSRCNSNSAGAANCQELRAVGVNTATGAFGQSATDASLPGMLPYGLTRSYSSNNSSSFSASSSGSLGAGWSAAWDAKLRVEANGDVTFHAEDGSEYPFAKGTGEKFESPITAHSTLRSIDSGYELTTNSGDRLSFDKTGKITRIQNRQDQGLTFNYEADLLKEVVAQDGRRASFAYTGKLVSEITLPGSRKVSYSYANGQLASVGLPGGQRIGYKYGTGGKLTDVIDSLGNNAVHNVYDASGRVAEQTSSATGKVSFSYKGSETDATLPDGGVWTDVYRKNVLLAQYDPFGNKTSHEYSYKLDHLAVVDALGRRFTTVTDIQGRPVEEQGPISKRKWAYDGSDLASYTDGNVKSSSFAYDSGHHLTTSTDPLGKVTFYTYTSNGQPETVTDPRGKVARFGYDTSGNPTSVTQPDGSRLTRKFDAADRVISETDPRGNESGADPAKFTTSYTWDDAGRLTSSTDAKGNTTKRTYDDAGNLATVVDAAGKTTMYTHDAANRLTEVKDPAGRVSRTTYDVMGNVASRADASGAKTTYTYDKAGRLLTMTTPRGNATGADPAKYTWKYGYDKVGNQTTVTDPLGNTTKTDYDAEYRPIAVTDALGRLRKTEYDGEGNITKVTDSLGNSNVNSYNANNQLLSTTDRGGKTVAYTYDDAGNLSSNTSPLGNKTTYGYDDNGRLVTTVEPRGNISGADPAQYTWKTAYDAAGYALSQTDPFGTKIFTNAHDGDGRLVERADALGKKTAYEYDARGQLAKVTAPDGGIIGLEYDALGNLTSRKDANGHTTTYAYDDASRLTKITDPLGRSTAYGYDVEGNRTTITNARGQKVTNTYDVRNLLTTATFSDGSPTISYTYDATRQPKTIKDGTGTRTVTYDDEGRPLIISAPGVTNPFKYAYNANGSIKSRTYPDGRTITYAYDNDGRTLSQTAGGKTTNYEWDAAGNLTSVKLPTTTAVTEARTYDRAGRLASVTQGTGARHVERDDAGRVIKDFFKDATTTGLADRYAYDAAGRMTRACTDTSATASCLSSTTGSTYNYDKTGNLTTSSTPTSTRTNTYDAADQLTKRVEGTTTVDFTYDADGNLTKDAAGAYAYDPLGRMKSATLGTDSYTFVNDADGNRTVANKNGALSRTSRWDVVNPLAQIATETNSTGALIADYQYNPEGVVESQNRSTGTFYTRHDRQNSITAVYDAAGKEHYTYTYSAWGVSTGKASIPDGQYSVFGYTGQYKDPVLSGRLYLRERSYDPGNRRFTTPDPEHSANDSPNQSPYAYANNDPINQSDPSGRCPMCISAGIGAVIGAAVESGIYGWQHRNGGFSWGDFGKAAGTGALVGGIAGALMPGAGNVAARSLGLTGGRALATSTAANAATGAGFSWGLNEAYCRPTTPVDLMFGAVGGGASSLVGPAFSWMKNRLFRPTVTVSAHTNDGLRGYAYRGLRSDEDPSQGLKAAGDNADVAAWQHVVQDNDSPWISLTRDPNVAWKYSGEGQKTIVAIDLSRVDSEMIDAAARLHVPHEFYNFAKDAAWRDKEVLVKFTIDARAIVKEWPAGTSFEQILRDIAELG